MAPFESSPPTADDRPRRFQFGLVSLLILTTLVAAVLAVLRPLKLPPWFHAISAIYAIFFAIYVAFEGVHLWQRWRWQVRRLHQRRRELQDWAQQQRTSPPGAVGSTRERQPRL